VPTRSDVHFEDDKIHSKNDEKQEKFQENVEKEKEKAVENSDRPLRAHSPLPDLIDRVPLPQPRNFPQPTQMTQPQLPQRAPSPPPVTQKRRGRPPKTVVVQPMQTISG
jgi:hypothetical protein